MPEPWTLLEWTLLEWTLPEWTLLGATAAGVAVAHTLLGPDHYLPFIAMFRAGQWTRARTLQITLLCGVGHIAASLALGLVAAGLGLSLADFSGFESVRAAVAGWGLILFGAGYGAWGLRRALRRPPHDHWHAHADGSAHTHRHMHAAEHVHFHGHSRAGALGVFSLFAIFILGPCEPLIPLLMLPAAAGNPGAIAWIAAIFAAATLASMLGVVWLGTVRSRAVRVPGGRFGHAFAGGLVCACGLLMQFAGL